MGFSETIKKEIREKAAFRCCRCQSIGPEVHHIIPLEHSGSDDMDNGAPLCPNCHSDFGSNIEKRKTIKEMRDWWYNRVKLMFGPSQLADLEKIDNMTQATHTDVKELKNLLKDFVDKSFSGDPKNESIKSIKNVTSGVITATTLGNKVHANFHCKKCNTSIGLLVGSNNCPNCGEPIY